MVFGFDPNDIAFVHKEHGFNAVFSLDVGEDDERLVSLRKKVGHSCFDADIDFALPGDSICGFDANSPVFLLINVFALLQGSLPPSKRYPPTTKQRADMGRQSFPIP
jgi:hypothetical protein